MMILVRYNEIHVNQVILACRALSFSFQNKSIPVSSENLKERWLPAALRRKNVLRKQASGSGLFAQTTCTAGQVDCGESDNETKQHSTISYKGVFIPMVIQY